MSRIPETSVYLSDTVKSVDFINLHHLRDELATFTNSEGGLSICTVFALYKYCPSLPVVSLSGEESPERVDRVTGASGQAEFG